MGSWSTPVYVVLLALSFYLEIFQYRVFRCFSKDLPQRLDTALGKLKSIWTEVGIAGEAYAVRDRAVALHVVGLLDQMIVEEEAMKAEILCNVEKHNIEVQQLTKELGLPPYEVRLTFFHA